MSEENILVLRELIEKCEPGRMVFFGGAGVSTESGLPDFRSKDGLYRQKTQYRYPPETILSQPFFEKHPNVFYSYFCDALLPIGVKPNIAHRKIAELEERGICRAVITQNVDGLHQAAGSQNVIELHGNAFRHVCMKCGRVHDIYEMLEARILSGSGVPYCKCGGSIKPDVVLYGETLNQDVLKEAARAIVMADLLVVAGTSLAVYPAAGLLQYFSGKHLVIINRDPTPSDRNADLVIHEKIGTVLDY